MDDVAQRFLDSPDREMSSREIGVYLLEQLKQMDKVAYLRFASVYLEFKDVRDFTKAIECLFERSK